MTVHDWLFSKIAADSPGSAASPMATPMSKERSGNDAAADPSLVAFFASQVIATLKPAP